LHNRRPGHGSGLGLSQVHGLAKQSGGDIRIESRPGEGTTVTLLMPRATTNPPPGKTPTAAVPPRAAAPASSSSTTTPTSAP
jgi:hypothetical protein